MRSRLTVIIDARFLCAAAAVQQCNRRQQPDNIGWVNDDEHQHAVILRIINCNLPKELLNKLTVVVVPLGISHVIVQKKEGSLEQP